jgi:hypothetical protein
MPREAFGPVIAWSDLELAELFTVPSTRSRGAVATTSLLPEGRRPEGGENAAPMPRRTGHERAPSHLDPPQEVPMTPHRRSLVAVAPLLALALALTTTPAHAAGSRTGATRAAKRHTIAYVKRYGITLRAGDLDLQCSVSGRSRWKCFVYANGGQCTDTLTEVYSTRARAYRARNIKIGCGE